jgi:hypothetical protein
MTSKEWKQRLIDEGLVENDSYEKSIINDLAAVEKERDEIRRLQNATVVGWDKERAGWLGTLDKSEHEGMRWKERTEKIETYLRIRGHRADCTVFDMPKMGCDCGYNAALSAALETGVKG